MNNSNIITLSVLDPEMDRIFNHNERFLISISYNNFGGVGENHLNIIDRTDGEEYQEIFPSISTIHTLEKSISKMISDIIQAKRNKTINDIIK